MDKKTFRVNKKKQRVKKIIRGGIIELKEKRGEIIIRK